MASNGAASGDIEVLKALYTSNVAAQAVLDYFAARGNNPREITVDDFESRLKSSGQRIRRSEILNVLRALEKAGCGAFKVGRRGKASRFIRNHKVNLIEVGRTAAGRTTQLPQMTEEQRGERKVVEPEAVFEGEHGVDGLLVHQYVLRPDLRVTVALPKDLTAREADRLASWIGSLPFGERP